MILDLSPEAAELGHQASRALDAAGGHRLVQQAEADPAGRAELVVPVLAELGAWDLDVRGTVDELEAAAALCRSAGSWAAPYPVAEVLAGPPGDHTGQLVVGGTPSAAVEGLPGPWLAVGLDGSRSRATPRRPSQPPRKTAFVVDLDLEPLDGDAPEVDVALGLVLPCWTLLGMLDRALDLTREHVLGRQQFGQPLARFQGVQFQLTDAEVERIGVEELAKHALWSIEARRPEALDDALALRLAAVEAADVVFRIAHQLHGAIGFCDETPLSWLSRASQPLRRLPTGPGAARQALTDRIGGRGLVGLFDAESAAR